jgi:hypothetical protein
MLYLDTSVLVALVCREPDSDRFVAWVADRAADGISISNWTIVEVASSLSLKMRMRAMTAIDVEQAKATLAHLIQTEFELVNLSLADFDLAARLCANWELNLRGPDALHLALVLRLDRSLVTLDRQQFAAAQHFGIASLIP